MKTMAEQGKLHVLIVGAGECSRKTPEAKANVTNLRY